MFELLLYEFWLYDTNDLKSPATWSFWWIKYLSAKSTKYIPKCWERPVERKSNLNFINLIKISVAIYSPNLFKKFS